MPSGIERLGSILVVEDEVLVARGICTQLEREGWLIVGVAATAAEALELARSVVPDLFLVDVRLRQGRDGIDLAHALRRSWDRPIVFLTSLSDEDTLDRMREIAPDGHLLKPWDPQLLLITVRHAVIRHRVESARRRAESLAAALFDHVPNAIVAVSGELLVERSNRAAESLIGGTPLGRHLTELLVFGGDRPRALHEVVDRAFDGEVVSVASDVYLHGDEGAPVAITVGPVEHLGQVVVVIEDLRRIRALECGLVQAERLSAVGQLAGIVAHDLANVLMAVGLSSWVAQRHATADETRESLRTIDSAVSHGKALTHQLLSMVRGGNGSNSGACDATRVLRQLEGLLRCLAGSGVRLRMRIPSFAPVAVSKGVLEQIVINLVANACDAVADGGAVELACVSRIREGHAGFDLSVADTGPGVPVELRDRIFEPMFTTKGTRGVGIGLASTRAQVEAAGGTITCTAGPDGLGTSMVAWIPRGSANNLDEGMAPTPEPSLDVRVSQGPHRGRILVVSRHDELRAALALALLGLGVDVVEARGPGPALTLAHNSLEEVEVCIVDDDLGVVTARELMGLLRRYWVRTAAVLVVDQPAEDRHHERHVVRSDGGAAVVEAALDLLRPLPHRW